MFGLTTLEDEKASLEACRIKLVESIDLNKTIRDKYLLIIKKVNNNDKPIYQEKLDKVNKDIEYYENAVKHIDNRVTQIEEEMKNANN